LLPAFTALLGAHGPEPQRLPRWILRSHDGRDVVVSDVRIEAPDASGGRLVRYAMAVSDADEHRLVPDVLQHWRSAERTAAETGVEGTALVAALRALYQYLVKEQG
jgi:hypothetical protein